MKHPKNNFNIMYMQMATCPLEFIHSNNCKPMNVKAMHGTLYFLTFINDYTRFGFVSLLSHCFESLDRFKRFF